MQLYDWENSPFVCEKSNGLTSLVLDWKFSKHSFCNKFSMNQTIAVYYTLSFYAFR